MPKERMGVEPYLKKKKTQILYDCSERRWGGFFLFVAIKSRSAFIPSYPCALCPGFVCFVFFFFQHSKKRTGKSPPTLLYSTSRIFFLIVPECSHGKLVPCVRRISCIFFTVRYKIDYIFRNGMPSPVTDWNTKRSLICSNGENTFAYERKIKSSRVALSGSPVALRPPLHIPSIVGGCKRKRF